MISYDTNIANWNFTIGTQQSGLSSVQTFTIALPIFSGLIGVWAEKAFPTMLIAPGSFYLQIRFAKVAQAFQFSMDPCRRIFGTYRDYVPNIGNVAGYHTEYGGNVITPNWLGYLDNNTAGTNTWLALTDNAANGTDFAYKGYSVDPVDDANAGGYVVDTNWKVFNKYNTSAKLAATALAANHSQLMGISEMDGFCTGNPKPQYIPVKTPWVYGQRFTDTLVPDVTSDYVKKPMLVLELIYRLPLHKYDEPQLLQMHVWLFWIRPV